MRRFLIFLLLFLLATCALGAARTASVDGAWSATATWGGAAVPTAADTCTINSGIEVRIDTNAVCGGVTNSGSLYTDDQCRTMTWGPAAAGSGATAAYTGAGTLGLKGCDVLEVDCTTDTSTTCELRASTGGSIVAHGRFLATGTVTAVSGENCSQGDYPDGIDSDACTDITLTVAVNDGSFLSDITAGDVLAPVWPSAHSDTWYDIATVTAPDTLVLDYNSRGQARRHGYQETGNGTIAASGTTFTATSGFSTFVTGTGAGSTEWLLGGYVFCDSDCTNTVNTSPANEDQWLPCANAARIASISSGTVLNLASSYSGAGCTAGAAHIIGNGTASWPMYEYVERFSPGDEFEIFRPVTITIPSANRDMNAQTHHYWIDVQDDAALDLKYASLQFLGRADSVTGSGGGMIEPFNDGFTSSNASGTLDLEWVEIAHMGGEDVPSVYNLSEDTTWKHILVRDPIPTDLTKPVSVTHGLILRDSGTSAVSFHIEDFRVMRMGQDAIGGSWTGQDYVDITGKRMRFVYNSTISPESDGNCIQFAAGGTTGVMEFEDVLCSNFELGGYFIPASDTSDTWGGRMLRNAVFQNIGTGGCYGSASKAMTYGDSDGHVVINVACLAKHTTPMGLHNADIYSSYVEANTALLKVVPVARGVMGVGSINGASTLIGFDTQLSDGGFSSDGPSCVDCALQTSISSSITGRGAEVGTGGSTYNTLLDHVTFYSGHSSAAVSVVSTGASSTPVNTIRNTIFFSSRNLGISHSTATLDEHHNGFWRVGGTGCSGCTLDGTSTKEVGTLSFHDLFLPNLTPAGKSTPLTFTTSDGTPLGARVAGPSHWERLELIYPPLQAKGRPGVYLPAYAIDTDGDGIYDIHDNNDAFANPYQRSWEASP